MELAAEFGELDDRQCPTCGSTRIASRRAYSAIALLILSYFAAGVIFSLVHPVRRCEDCGAGWREGAL